MATAYLGLGSNMGDREQNLAQALGLLSQKMLVEQLSSIYETEPVGCKEQPHFLNAVCRISTDLSPDELLNLAKEIESRMGRLPSFPNAPRPIDIDILFYGEEMIQSQNLTIPHPRLAERAFVLVPLAEIAHDLVYPGSGKSIGELASSLQSLSGINKWIDAKEIFNRRQDVSSIS